MFYVCGNRIDKNCAQCPQTARTLEKIPGMTSALFSTLAPGTSLAPHRGMYKGVLRYHLGLIVSDPEECGIRVGHDKRHWHEGESLVFDDTHDHEVWNNSENTRVVLLLDFLRDLPFPLRQINLAVTKLISVSPVVGEMLAKLNNRVVDVRHS
jgi:aspartyl/asparaginyl beta-hydroxylase (cupin superfamily)